VKAFALTIVVLHASLALAEDDQWTIGPESAQGTPQGATAQQEKPLPAGSILKWCEENGKKVRYSQTFVPGYRLCGEVETSTLCDPSGRRFISSPGAPTPSIAYKDCSLGERIKVVRSEPLPTPEPGELPPLPSAEPMTRAEKAAAKKDLARIQKDQEGELAREIQGIMQELSKAMNGLGGSKDGR